LGKDASTDDINEVRRLMGFKYPNSGGRWATNGGLDQYKLFHMSIIDRSRLPACSEADFQKMIDGMPLELAVLFGQTGLNWGDVTSQSKLEECVEGLAEPMRRAYASHNPTLARRIYYDLKLISRMAYKLKDVDTESGEVKGIDTARAMTVWAVGQYALALHLGLLVDAQAIMAKAENHFKTDWKPEPDKPVRKGFRRKPKPPTVKVIEYVDPNLETS
jgi:hypothetical protein